MKKVIAGLRHFYRIIVGVYGITHKVVVSAFVVLVFLSAFTISPFLVQAQTSVSFTRNDRFPLPDSNAVIGFGSNGTYSQATQEQKFWVFTNLKLGNFSGTLPTLSVSAQNSNITITRLQRGNVNPNSSSAFFTLASVRYTVSSAGGVQSFKFGLNLTGGFWMVTFNGTSYPDQGDGWNVSTDGTIVITGATVNVTASYIVTNNRFDDSSLPFYEQHSVAISTGLAVAVTLVVAAAFIVRNRMKENQKEISYSSDTVLRSQQTD